MKHIGDYKKDTILTPMFVILEVVMEVIIPLISPVLLLTVITGALSKKMRQEIPECIKWFRLASYLLLIVMPFVITS